MEHSRQHSFEQSPTEYKQITNASPKSRSKRQESEEKMRISKRALFPPLNTGGTGVAPLGQ